ncbi:hypothetical protein JCM3770_003845 [Rhodotorula araucariae]
MRSSSPPLPLRSSSETRRSQRAHSRAGSTESGALPIEHFAGLAPPEGVLAAREADVEAYVALSRRVTSTRGAPRGESGDEEELEGDSSEKKVDSRAEDEEADTGTPLEEAWTYPDGGLRAWGVVFGVWCLSASQLGYGLVFGVLLEDLEERLHQTPATLNFIQGLTNFGMNAVSFVAGRLGDRYGFKRCIGIGCVLSILSLVGSALSYKSLIGLFLVQGAMLGLAQGIGMSLFMAVPSQWFLHKRGLATGLAMSGSGIGGAIASLILRGTIKLGYRNALLIYTGCNAVAYIIGFILIEERHPPLRPGERRVPKNWLPTGVWTDGRFYSLMGSVAVAVFGYLTPFYFITALTTQQCPEYADNSLLLASPLIVGAALSGIGRVMGGFIADRIGPVNTLISSFFLGGVLQLAIWPRMHSFATIMTFACLYGWFGSWFVPLLAPACAQIFGTKGLATMVGFGVLCNAPGQFLGGSIAGWVLGAAGGNYGTVGYYSGTVMLSGAFILLYARFKGQGKLWAKY